MTFFCVSSQIPSSQLPTSFLQCFFLNSATFFNFIRVSPLDGVTRGGPPLPPSNATAYSKTCRTAAEPESTPPPKPDLYMKQIHQLNEDRQQMEASNRWRLLQSQTPSHDVGALRRKVAFYYLSSFSSSYCEAGIVLGTTARVIIIIISCLY